MLPLITVSYMVANVSAGLLYLCVRIRIKSVLLRRPSCATRGSEFDRLGDRKDYLIIALQ